MEMCASGNAYSLTGSIFSNKRDVIDEAKNFPSQNGRLLHK